MRIGINFHPADRYISGVEYYSLGLINSLLSIDGKNEYCVFTNQPELLKKHVIQSSRLTVRNLDNLNNRLSRVVWEHLRLPHIAKREGLDVLHCPQYICPSVGDTVPYVVTVHDTIAVDYPKWCRPSNVIYYNLFMKKAVEKASRVIAVSHNTANHVNSNFAVNGEKVRVVYPGIDVIFNTNKDYHQQNNAKIRYALPQRYILFVGNIEPKKNVMKLLQAYKLLHKKGIPHKLVMVGRRTWKSEHVWNYIYQEFDRNDVIVTGYVERKDLPSVYQMADVFVFPSFYEGFGFPPLEAMACGTPVVASNMGALNETIGKAAYIVDPSDAENIAHAIYLLVTDGELRRRYRELGLKQSYKFGWKNAARQTLSIYEEAVGANA